MTEPTTLLTDYLLGGLAGVLAWRLVRDQVRLKPDIGGVRLKPDISASG